MKSHAKQLYLFLFIIVITRTKIFCTLSIAWHIKVQVKESVIFFFLKFTARGYGFLESINFVISVLKKSKMHNFLCDTAIL